MSGHSEFAPIGNNIPVANPPQTGSVGPDVRPPNASVLRPQGGQEVEPPNPPNARSLAQKLDAMLLRAAKMSTKSVDADSLKAATQTLGLGKAEQQALKSAADKAHKTLKAISCFTGRQIASALAADEKGVFDWKQNGTAGQMDFYPGFDITPTTDPLGFRLGPDCFDNGTEVRRLDAIRRSLRDPDCAGPEDVYAIMMDVGRRCDRAGIESRNLLFGVVTYAAGRLGDEPIRSQGHIHAVSASCGWSTPELYEIWDGEAVIYMQERAEDDPGRCFAVRAKAGDVVVVPPYWAHATISADSSRPLTFGAWCVRDFGFDYRGVRAHGGIAFFPLFGGDGTLRWEKNPAYGACRLVEKAPEQYPGLGVARGESVYSQFVRDPDRFLWVARPVLKEREWVGFVP